MMLTDVMSPLQSCPQPSDSLRVAVRFLKNSGFDVIPVTDEFQRLVGVFTRPTLYQMLLEDLPLETQIRSYMKHIPVSRPYDTSFDEIKEHVRDSKEVTFIVLDHNQRVLGVLTKSDMKMMQFCTPLSFKEPLEKVLDSTYLGAFIMDKEDPILIVNENILQIFRKEEGRINSLSLLSEHPELNLSLNLVSRDQTGQELTVMRFDTTFEQLCDGLMMVDETGKIIFINPPLAEFFSLEKELYVGKPVEQVFPQLEINRVLETGVDELSEVLEFNGTSYLVQIMPVIQDGCVIGAIGKVLFRRLNKVCDVIRRFHLLENQGESFKEQINHVNSAKFSFDDIITSDSVVENIKRTAYKAAKGLSTILLRGESGTGKELFAHAIHRASERKHGQFVMVNCAAIPEHLLESEFFGYEPGSFTGADKRGKIGKLDLANGGTLFLDEIGDMSPALQAKLLRVLQDREFYRIGGTEQISVDIRVIVATNRALEQMVEKGEFREDLYYRLNVIMLEIPPLRERHDADIIALTNIHIKKLNTLLGTSITGIDPAAKEVLLKYNWPGNVRELRNVIERAMTFAEHGKIRASDFPNCIRKSIEGLSLRRSIGRESDKRVSFSNGESEFLLEKAVETAERNAIQLALQASLGNKSRAAKMLGLSRSSFYEKLDKYQL